RDHPNFEVLHEPTLSIYSFRFVPQQPEWAAEALDRLNQDIAEEIQRSGLALVMTTRIRGRVALRLSICSQRTMEEDIDRTFEAIVAAGRRLSTIAA
ncbi:MAG: aspartate aminotransferase family protein, partial [Thermoanaerobaculia bacterium]